VTVEGVRGLAESVDTNGALLVRGSDGAIRRVLAGDVALGNEQHGHQT
jgi:hypothetical protein